MTLSIPGTRLGEWTEGSRAETALSMAEYGLSVFPCEPDGKRPLTGRGFYDASADPERIRAQWRRTPNANIGWPIPTGMAVGDFDDLEEAERLEAKHGRFTSPLAQRTGRGAQLFWTTSTEIRNSASKVAPGLDIRGVGGYVIVPSSRHQNGKQYEWVDLDGDGATVIQPSPMPAWIVTALTTPTPVRSSYRPERLDDRQSSERFGEGRRNDGLARIAGGLRRQGCDELTILSTLETVNQRQCDPPLDDREVHRIAQSVARYAPAPSAPSAPSAPISTLRPRPVILLDRQQEGA